MSAPSMEGRHSYAAADILSGCVFAAQMRSTRNFCLDVILILIILGLGVYIWQLFKG